VKEDLPDIHQLKNADRDTFITAVYSRYGRKLYAYAIHSWKLNEDAAWELIYKTIYKTADTYSKYEFASEEKFAAFIFKIFINYLRNYYRDHKQEKAFTFSLMDDVDLSTKQIEAEVPPGAKMTALNEVLESMQDWERMLLLMRSDGRAYSEIAKYIDKPENQLKVYYQRLKEQLTKKLNGAG